MSVEQSAPPPAELTPEQLEEALKGDQNGPEYQRGDIGFHNPGDLLANREHSTAGAGLIDAANLLDKAVDDGNKVGIGLGSVGVTLETLGLVLDPLGSVLAAGIGWLIEHVTPLRWPLDVLHGDPFGISTAAAAIENEKNAMEIMATQHQAKLATLMSSWQGPAADEFKGHMDAVTAGLETLGKAIDFAGKQMKIAGGIIGAFRGIIRDMIAMFLAMLLKGALIALALAPFSFGASIAAFIMTTIGGVITLLSKISTSLSKLTSTMTSSLKNMGNVSKATDNFNSAVSNAGKTGGKTSGKPTLAPGSGGGKPIPKPPGGNAAPTKPQRTGTAPASTVAPPPKVTDGGALPKPQRAETAPPAVTPPPMPKPAAGGAPPAKPAAGANTGGKWSDRLKNHKFPMVDKAVQQATRDALENALKRFPPPGRLRLSQLEINAILSKFDEVGTFPRSYIEKIFGESGTRAIEGTLRTMNDPLYGGRGAAGKAINEVTKGTGPNGDETER